MAEEAKRLLKGNAVERETAESILKATADHIKDEWSRERLVEKWAGYGWYYFCEDGVYGSKFSPASLQLIAQLNQARGNGLVELITWLTGYQKVDDCERRGDFYHYTHVKNEPQSPSLTESALEKKLHVATHIRGSEADRVAAVNGYQTQSEKFGGDNPHLEKVWEILQGEKQNYAAALKVIQELELQPATTSSNTAMGEALKKAGLK